MSRTGWSTSNYLRRASGLITAAPLTIAAWFKSSTSVTGNPQTVAGLFTSGSAGNRNEFRLRLASASAAVQASTGDASAEGSANSTAGYTVDTWNHACAVYASATDRRAFLNGANKGTNTTSLTPSGINRSAIGCSDGSSAIDAFDPGGTGFIAEVSYWNEALTDALVASLATGIWPPLVKPSSLVAHFSIRGSHSPENNTKSNSSTMAIIGALSDGKDHPPIFAFPGNRLITLPAFIATGQPTWKRFGGVEFMGGSRTSRGARVWDKS